MKKIFTILVAFFLTLSVFAQSPEKMSYQAVIRTIDDGLLTNTQVGMRISILQGSVDGTAVYVETQIPKTNANGLISLEIGTGTVVSGNFTTINWANDIFFIKTETDPAGGTNYSITGTSQLLSVPYALHSKTAETVTGAINETDPVFNAWDKSTGISITESQISDLNHFTTEDETDPVFGSSIAGGITATDTANWNAASTGSYNETDPIYTSSEAANITSTDITNLGNLSGTNTGDQDISGLATKTALGDSTAQLRSEIPTVPTGTEIGEMQYWNGTAWVTIAPTDNDSATLQMIGGMPTWVGGTIQTTSSVTNPATGEVWMDRSLGASQIATSSSDADALGDLYQWGRGTDGHEKRTSGTTSTLATTDNPGHGDFIIINAFPYDWRNPQNDNLWQGVSGTNNPCPSGYRLPTEAEWEAERASWSSNNTAGAFDSPLKLPATGYRFGSNGDILDAGTFGYYWSSTVNGNNSRCLYISSTDAFMFDSRRNLGGAVRCIKD